MTITLPDELKDALERKAREAGFATVAEFVTDLIEGAISADGDSAPLPDPPPAARYAAQNERTVQHYNLYAGSISFLPSFLELFTHLLTW